MIKQIILIFLSLAILISSTLLTSDFGYDYKLRKCSYLDKNINTEYYDYEFERGCYDVIQRPLLTKAGYGLVGFLIGIMFLLICFPIYMIIEDLL